MNDLEVSSDFLIDRTLSFWHLERPSGRRDLKTWLPAACLKISPFGRNDKKVRPREQVKILAVGKLLNSFYSYEIKRTCIICHVGR